MPPHSTRGSVPVIHRILDAGKWQRVTGRSIGSRSSAALNILQHFGGVLHLKTEYATQYCRAYCGTPEHAPSVVRLNWRYAQCIACATVSSQNHPTGYEFVAFPDELAMFPPPKNVRVLDDEEFEFKDAGIYSIHGADSERVLLPRFRKYKKYTVNVGPGPTPMTPPTPPQEAWITAPMTQQTLQVPITWGQENNE